jgi:hypothetical protein
VDVPEANGWNVWPLDNGDWAWTVWVAGNGRSGLEATELEAQNATQRELELMVSEASAAAHQRRELSVPDDGGKRWEPQL